MFIVIILDGMLYIEQEGPEGQKTLLARMLPGHLFPTSSRRMRDRPGDVLLIRPSANEHVLADPPMC